MKEVAFVEFLDILIELFSKAGLPAGLAEQLDQDIEVIHERHLLHAA